MALFNCNYYSRVLARNVSFIVFLPGDRADRDVRRENGKYRTLYVLHGGLEDCHAWIERSSVLRYAEKHDLAVVSVSYENSYLTDLRTGQQFWTWINHDLIPYVRRTFPLSDRREDNFVAGASMGGYCAAKLALRNPDTFAGLAVFSGAVDTGDELKGTPDPMNCRNPFFLDAFGSGEAYRGSENDVVHLLRSFAKCPEKLPRIYQCCGTEDHLFRDNRLWYELAESVGADIFWHEQEAGHTWEFWDGCIPQALEILCR